MHLELVSDCFHCLSEAFIGRLANPPQFGVILTLLTRQTKELIEFLQQQKTNKMISDFCSFKNIDWVFIPEHAPHFGGLWEAAVKSFQARIAANVKHI